MYKASKPFACQECGKQLTYGQAQAASFRGCPKCGSADIDVNGSQPGVTVAQVDAVLAPGQCCRGLQECYEGFCRCSGPFAGAVNAAVSP